MIDGRCQRALSVSLSEDKGMSKLSSSEDARGTQPGGRQQGKREWLMVTLESLEEDLEIK